MHSAGWSRDDRDLLWTGRDLLIAGRDQYLFSRNWLFLSVSLRHKGGSRSLIFTGSPLEPLDGPNVGNGTPIKIKNEKE